MDPRYHAHTYMQVLQDYLCDFEAQGLPVLTVQYGNFGEALDILHEYVLMCIQVRGGWCSAVLGLHLTCTWAVTHPSLGTPCRRGYKPRNTHANQACCEQSGQYQGTDLRVRWVPVGRAARGTTATMSVMPSMLHKSGTCCILRVPSCVRCCFC